jgi:predicted dehydrogenase
MAKKSRKTQPLRIAYIGCGGIAGRHTPPLLEDPRAEITHLVDPVKNKIHALKARFPDLAHVPEHIDYREVLDDVDAVVILSPHTLHHEQILAALDAKLHVLCEKPLACTVAHAQEIVDRVRTSRRKLQIAYQRRTWPVMQFIREQIASKQLGRLQFIDVTLCQAWLQKQKGTWRMNPALSGGGELNDSGSHLMDCLLWFASGLPEEVAAWCHNRGQRVDVDTTANARWKNGLVASVAVIGSAWPFSERWIISGSKGTLVFEGGAIKKITEPHGEWAETGELPPRDDGIVARNWLDAIEGKAKLLSPAKSAIGVTQITEAMWKSSEKGGKPVKV